MKDSPSGNRSGAGRSLQKNVFRLMAFALLFSTCLAWLGFSEGTDQRGEHEGAHVDSTSRREEGSHIIIKKDRPAVSERGASNQHAAAALRSIRGGLKPDHEDYPPSKVALDTAKCSWWVGEHLYERWRKNRRAVCSSTSTPKEAPPRTAMALDLSAVTNKTALSAFLAANKINEKQAVLKAVPIESEIEAYQLAGFEYVPLIRRYRNVALTSYLHGHMDKLACTADYDKYVQTMDFKRTLPVRTPASGNANVSRVVDVISDRTIIRVHRFDNVNPYEAFHIYINMYLTFRVLGFLDHAGSAPSDGGAAVRNVQFVFVDPMGFAPFDELMWRAFNNDSYPLVYGPAKKGRINHTSAVNRPVADVSEGTLVHDVIDAPTAAMSLISTGGEGANLKNRRKATISLSSSQAQESPPPPPTHALEKHLRANPLKGRHSDHHCKSSAAREVTHWMRRLYGVAPFDYDGNTINVTNSRTAAGAKPPIPNATTAANTKLRVIFSIRKPYMREGRLFHVQRMLENEEDFIARLSYALGDRYEVTAVDFASMPPADCIRLVSHAHAMVGAHGGGMMWSAFLPRHALLVEMFGADRQAGGERHYHNVASLFDFHHRQLSLATIAMPNNVRGLRWHSWDIDTVVRHFKTTPLLKVDEPK